MKKTLFILTVVLVSILILATASATQRWIQGSKTEFLKGTPESASVTSSGEIVLPPAAVKKFSTSEPFIWDIAVDSQGKFYSAGGNVGIIYDLMVIPFMIRNSLPFTLWPSALTTDSILAPPPMARFTKPALMENPSSFSSPAILPGPRALLKALQKDISGIWFLIPWVIFMWLGLEGRVYKVTPDGKGTIIFDSDEANITCITIDSRGRILFGSDPGDRFFNFLPTVRFLFFLIPA